MGTKQTKQTKPTPPLPDLHLPANITHPLVATVSESAGRLWNKTIPLLVEQASGRKMRPGKTALKYTPVQQQQAVKHLLKLETAMQNFTNALITQTASGVTGDEETVTKVHQEFDQCLAFVQGVQSYLAKWKSMNEGQIASHFAETSREDPRALKKKADLLLVSLRALLRIKRVYQFRVPILFELFKLQASNNTLVKEMATKFVAFFPQSFIKHFGSQETYDAFIQMHMTNVNKGLLGFKSQVSALLRESANASGHAQRVLDDAGYYGENPMHVLKSWDTGGRIDVAKARGLRCEKVLQQMVAASEEEDEHAREL